jgi:glycosyltransferase involved in cell wall biosynthesis
MSVIIPNRNGSRTIGDCIESALGSSYGGFEVIVVDDGSTDDSVNIVEKYPCRLIKLERHSGASAARNAGARAAEGEMLFFIDADCIMMNDTIETAAKSFHAHPDDVTGGTYTPIAYDEGFFSTFQSLFINYSETKTPRPDYVPTHAMVISKKLFDESGGFDEDFMPILEDVEFSHRLKRKGVKLRVQPSLQVSHVFNFNLWRSLKNAFRKSFYWTMYSINNRDLFKDSGTASLELKADVASWLICISLLILFFITGETSLLVALAVACGINILINRKFIGSMVRAAGPGFAFGATLYYTALYPLAVAAGGFLGATRGR